MVNDLRGLPEEFRDVSLGPTSDVATAASSPASESPAVEQGLVSPSGQSHRVSPDPPEASQNTTSKTKLFFQGLLAVIAAPFALVSAAVGLGIGAIGAALGVTLAAVALVPAAVIAAGGKIHSARRQTDLKQQCTQMKTQEEQTKFKAMQDRLGKTGDLVKDRIPNDKKIATETGPNNLSSEEIGEVFTRDLDPQSQAALKPLIKEMAQLLRRNHDPNPDHGRLNQELLSNLRTALNNPAYQTVKQINPSHPAVQFFQQFAVGIYHDVKALKTYKDLGSNILKSNAEKSASKPQANPANSGVNPNQGTRPPREGQQIAQALKAAHSHANSQIYTDHGLFGKVGYAMTHTTQAIGSMASEGGKVREIARALTGEDVYDPAALRNNPSIQSQTTWVQQAKDANQKTVSHNVTVNNIYGGSPTVGDHAISPEFKALLDAVKTNRERKLRGEAGDPNIPDRIVYTNFQNINKVGGEGPRSVTIMSLANSEEYRDCFHAITLPKDSPFYLSNFPWPGAQTYGNRMLETMLDDSSFSLENRTSTNKGQGFYLGENTPENKLKWRNLLTPIMAQANERFKNVHKGPENPTPEQSQQYRQAYQEYFYSMIQASMEMIQAQSLIESGIKNPTISTIRACKENIDRGGAENVKYMYTRIPPGMNPQEKLDLLAGGMFCRAISSRDRNILGHRVDPMLSFMKHVDPQDFQNDLKAVVNGLNQTQPHGLNVGAQNFTPLL